VEGISGYLVVLERIVYNIKMNPPDIIGDWKKRRGVLATMHHKEKVVSPILHQELGIDIVVPTNFNTDIFGTFTRDTARSGDQLEAARHKALAAMEHTGLDLAVANEGSFGSHPSIPFLSSNLEIVLLVDKKNGLEIVGHYRSSGIQVRGQEVYTAEEAVLVAQAWGFPEQGVIVRRSEESMKDIYKEIRTIDELKSISKILLAKWFTKSIFLETDMRAHRCPSRMNSIKEATIDLVKSCRSFCPKCNVPGFVVTEAVPGLPCSGCGLPTDQTKQTRYSCNKCHYQEIRKTEGTLAADPGHCERCNP